MAQKKKASKTLEASSKLMILAGIMAIVFFIGWFLFDLVI